jgi:hypothetical protein
LLVERVLYGDRKAEYAETHVRMLILSDGQSIFRDDQSFSFSFPPCWRLREAVLHNECMHCHLIAYIIVNIMDQMILSPLNLQPPCPRCSPYTAGYEAPKSTNISV